jgi:GDP-D-mannose dehydratase
MSMGGLFLHYGDIADSTNLTKLLYRIQPDEVDRSHPGR